MASSRERLLAALKHKPVDRLPWTALITDYYLKSLPPAARLASDRDVLEYAGADLLHIGPMGLAVTTRDAQVETVRKCCGDTVTTTLVTPRGSLREQRRATEAGTSFRTRLFLRDAQDCRAMSVSILLFGVLLPKRNRDLTNLTVWDQVGGTLP